MRLTRQLLALLLSLLAFASVCIADALKPQTTCPEMGGPINKELYVDYQGKRIYLCCEPCRANVEKEPEKYLKKLEAMGEAAQPIPTGERAASTTQPGTGKAGVRTLGIFLFPDFETLDVFGPLEMWGNLRGKVKVVMVSATGGEAKSAQGQKIVTDCGINDCPPLDLILIPGGAGGLIAAKRDPLVLSWLREQGSRAELIMSVCNGATILEAAGLLDGRPATTNKYLFRAISSDPETKVKWQPKARWVDDGNIVTSSGVSAGIDMSLHVIERLYGRATAEALAVNAEYERHVDPAWDPFAAVHGLIEGK